MLCRCFSMNCFAFAFLLLATQFLSLSFLFFAVASPCPALPLLIKATPCIHSLCCAAHIGSMQFHCSSEPCFAMPLQISSNHRIAIASPYFASHRPRYRLPFNAISLQLLVFPCLAFAPLLKAVPWPCCYQQFRAVPLRSESYRVYAIPLRICSILCIAFDTRFKATLCHCLAFH